MTRESYNKNKELIEQWLDGAEIEFSLDGGKKLDNCSKSTVGYDYYV